MRRTIDWDGDAVTIIDQTALPADYRVLTLHTVDELIDAIRRLVAAANRSGAAIRCDMAALQSGRFVNVGHEFGPNYHDFIADFWVLTISRASSATRQKHHQQRHLHVSLDPQPANTLPDI